MLTLTRQMFIDLYNAKPSELFDLTKILNDEHRKEALQYTDPNRCLVRMEFGTIEGVPRLKLKPLIYALEVGYWSDAGRFMASIDEYAKIYSSPTNGNQCKCERDDCWQDTDGDIHCNKGIPTSPKVGEVEELVKQRDELVNLLSTVIRADELTFIFAGLAWYMVANDKPYFGWVIFAAVCCSVYPKTTKTNL